MRKSFEIAWATACLFAYDSLLLLYFLNWLILNFRKQPLGILAVDDIMFQRPVEIGSLLFLSSRVVYVEGNKIQTRVLAEVVDIHTAKRETTNVFYFIFKTKNQTNTIPNVVPKTYAEAMMYLDGKRHLT